jgi:hypothetical protein
LEKKDERITEANKILIGQKPTKRLEKFSCSKVSIWKTNTKYM